MIKAAESEGFELCWRPVGGALCVGYVRRISAIRRSATSALRSRKCALVASRSTVRVRPEFEGSTHVARATMCGHE